MIPDWKAHWIWQKAEPAKPNTYIYFRRSFALVRPPEKAMCYVSADTSYRLFVNAVFVGWGPVLSEPRWQSYDAYDITDLLCAGENVIGAIAYHFGNAADNPGGYTLHWSRGGFLCQVDLEDSANKMASIISDYSWEVLESSAWSGNAPKMDSMTYAEMYDARKEPENWLRPGFANNDWVPSRPRWSRMTT